MLMKLTIRRRTLYFDCTDKPRQITLAALIKAVSSQVVEMRTQRFQPREHRRRRRDAHLHRQHIAERANHQTRPAQLGWSSRDLGPVNDLTLTAVPAQQ